MEKYLGKQWYSLLKDVIEKPFFKRLAYFISVERKKYVVYPKTGREVFSVFKNLQPSDVRVVIVGQDPYPDGSYDGRAFSNTDKKKISPSLVNILKEVREDVYDGWEMYQDPCLKRWEDQGVFLINRVLTVREGEPGSHRSMGWEIFTGESIKRLSETQNNIVFLLWGGQAHKIEKYISNKENKHLILKSGHPSPLSANKGGWFGNKHFSKTNNYLLKNGMDYIEW